MDKQEIYKFMRENPAIALATADDDKPYVRIIMLYRADEAGIIFNTGENKDLNRQLRRNPMVEMCFIDAKKEKQIRVSGTVEEIEDIELKKQVVRDWPFLKEWVDREGIDVLVVYCLKGGRASIWTMESNYAQKEYIEL
jgi:pyridoxamine 5'-phosphate oxidase